MIVASSNTAIAMPIPRLLMMMSWPVPKAAKTETMIRAAPVMTRPVLDSPSATAFVVSPSRRYASWMRDSSSTS
jgi:hypothetical protein